MYKREDQRADDATATQNKSSYSQMVEPPPPPPSRVGSTAGPFSSLPHGWTTSCDPHNGRMYYWNTKTNETSWIHPSAVGVVVGPLSSNNPRANNRGGGLLSTVLPSQPPHGFSSGEHPSHASRRPDNHECYALAAFVLCPPIGFVACFHAWRSHTLWNQGRYSESVHHARQAPQYACFACAVGVAFWIFVLVIREESKVVDWEWPDCNFD